MLVSVNGEIQEGTIGKFDLNDKGLNYGFGVFETMRTYDHDVFKLDEHIERLFASADIIGLKSSHTTRSISEIIDGMLEKWKKTNESEARIKLTLTDKHLIVYFVENIFDHAIYKGVSVISYKGERFLPKAKTLNCLVSYIANTKAKSKGVYEAILVSSDGFVTEGAYSNIFWVKSGVLFTTDKGILNGITRETILENAKVHVPDIQFINSATIDTLKIADEVFLSQSSKGIVPITSIDGSPIGSSQAGECTEKLMGIFEDLEKTN